MDELYQFLDHHGLDITATRRGSDQEGQRWYVGINNLYFESINAIVDVRAFGNTQIEAALRCLQIIKENRCFVVKREVSEKRVYLPRPEVFND